MSQPPPAAAAPHASVEDYPAAGWPDAIDQPSLTDSLAPVAASSVHSFVAEESDGEPAPSPLAHPPLDTPATALAPATEGSLQLRGERQPSPRTLAALPTTEPQDEPAPPTLWVPGGGFRGFRSVSCLPDSTTSAPAPAPAPSRFPRSINSWGPVSEAEALGLASRFAADYLSWDQDHPERRAEALRSLLADPSMAAIGWSGRGWQRADLVNAGRTMPLREGAVLIVEVTVRIAAPESTGRPALAVAASSAPAAPTPDGQPCLSWWVRLAPPIRRGRAAELVVDLCVDPSIPAS